MNTRVDLSFPKSRRLLLSSHYQRITRKGERRVGQWIVIDVLQGKYHHSQLGITVSTKYGKAHNRNRFKRIVREAFRKSQPLLASGIQINVRPRSSAGQATAGMIQKELLSLLGCVHDEQSISISQPTAAASS